MHKKLPYAQKKPIQFFSSSNANTMIPFTNGNSVFRIAPLSAIFFAVCVEEKEAKFLCMKTAMRFCPFNLQKFTSM